MKTGTRFQKMISGAALVVFLGGCTEPASTQSEQSQASSLPDNQTIIETRIGSLTYQSGFPTASTSEKLYNEMDFQRAVLAHQHSDNLVSYYSMNFGFLASSEGSKEGDLFVWENFADPKAIVLTGNDTTIYGMSFLNLKENGPMVVEVPPSPFLGGLFDLWMVPIAAIDAKGGTFVIASEDYEGEIKVPEGATLIRSQTNMAAFFARGLVINNDMDAAVKAVTDCKVFPLSQIASPPETKVVLVTGVPMDTISPMEPKAYWTRVAKVLDFVNPEMDEDASLLISLLKPLGIEPGKPFSPDARQTKILHDAAHFGWLMAQNISLAPRFDDIIYYPGTQWEWVLQLDPTLRDQFMRDMEARTNYYFQATMALPAMKNKAIGKGSQYIRSARNSSGEWLDGGNQYRLNVPANAPVELFWSITLYDYETRSQIQTDTNNPSLSSYDDLKKNDDGSVDLYFGPSAVPEGYENNWVKTIPGRGWWVWFRFYSPTEAFFDKSWQLPDFEKLN